MFKIMPYALASVTLFAMPGAGFAQQTMDPVFAEHQKAWTTKQEFTSPLVDHLPASTTVPSPRAVLGHDIGAPRVLDHYADILKYYRALAAKTKRVKIIETGATEEGRPTVIVLISADENIANLEVNRQNLVKLGDPRDEPPRTLQVRIRAHEGTGAAATPEPDVPGAPPLGIAA